MFALIVFILAFSSTFQSFKCQNTQYQNGYMPQNGVRQTNPNTGQQVDVNGNPIPQGQPINGQQQPMPTNGNLPGMGNQIPGQNPMQGQNPIPGQNQIPNPGFPQQNPSLGGQNQQPQFPQNPQMPGVNQQLPPTNQQFPLPNQQYPPYQGGYPINQNPNQYGPNGRVNHYPEAPHDLHLYPEGEFAYGYIMHTIASMLNNPTSRNNLFSLFNNLQMVMSNPKSGPIIQEFFNRWAHAIDGTTAQIGSNWANTGMQAVQGTISPLLGSTTNINGQPMTITTPGITVQ